MSKSDKHQPKLLIVEDNLQLASLYEFKFKHEGFDVAVAENGAAGLALARELKPDIVLLDLRMPIMTGDEMLEKMRAEEWGGDIKVVVLTNISKDEAPKNLRFLSVDRYIVKAHHTPAQIVATTREVLSLRA